MKKQISGWGKNIFVNTNISFPKNLSQLKRDIRKTVLQEVWEGHTVIVLSIHKIRLLQLN